MEDSTGQIPSSAAWFIMHVEILIHQSLSRPCGQLRQHCCGAYGARSNSQSNWASRMCARRDSNHHHRRRHSHYC